jgi:tetratricopeptide (TPR) repeat protein
MADRYTYIPSIGFCIAVVWLVCDLYEKLISNENTPPLLKRTPAVVSVMILLGLSMTAFFQVGYWRNSITLFEHALNVTKENYIAHAQLGSAYSKANRFPEALVQYYLCLKIMPYFPDAQTSLGSTLLRMGNPAQALPHLQIGLKFDPDNDKLHTNTGCALAMLGRLNESEAEFKQAIKLNPYNKKAVWGLETINEARQEMLKGSAKPMH